MEIQECIERANERLRSFGVTAMISDVNGWLYLRATLPPRPNSDKEHPYQQRLALKLKTSSRTVAVAEKEARKVGVLLDAGEFRWEPYVRHRSIGSVGDWVGRLREEYLAAGGGRATWEGDYEQSFKKLPQAEQLSVQLLVKVAKTVKANTKSRQRVCMTFARLARFAELDPARIVALRGSYSSKSVDPRSLPSDALIAKWRAEVARPDWQWCFGMLACYGLRPHELFHCDMRDFPTVRIASDTKTGARFVWPLYPEWAHDWQLHDRQLPALVNVAQLPNTKLGSKVSKRFYEWQLMKPDGESLRPYDLRHCFARRCLEFGFAPEFGAKMMGHSEATHNKVYRRWIDEGTYRAVYEAALSRDDRPLPPGQLPLDSS